MRTPHMMVHGTAFTAKELLQAYLAGNLTDCDRPLLRGWLAAHPYAVTGHWAKVAQRFMDGTI